MKITSVKRIEVFEVCIDGFDVPNFRRVAGTWEEVNFDGNWEECSSVTSSELEEMFFGFIAKSVESKL